MVQQALQQFGDEAGVPSVKLALGPMEKFVLPAELGVAVPQLKVVESLLGWLAPPNVLNLTGSLLMSNGDLGAGLSLSLKRAGTEHVLYSCTLWERDYDPVVAATPPVTPAEASGDKAADEKKGVDAAAYYLLTEPAAVWTRFKLAQYELERPRFFVVKLINKVRRFLK
jgi:hypothetical protein